jgi:SnoaL-like polyketide cyclase
MSIADNSALLRRYFEEVHNGRMVAVLDEILAADLLEPTRAVVAAFQKAFPDYRITITAQVAEADLVAAVWSATGTHQGESSAWGMTRVKRA